MNATFRISRTYGWIGGACTLFFAAMAVASVLGIYLEAPPEGRRQALIVGLALGAFWMAWLALCLWMLLECWRHRLVVSDRRIDSIGVIRRKLVCLSELTSVRWRCSGIGGRVVLRTTAARLAIELGNYQCEARRQIIRIVRESVPLPIQAGWGLFYVRIVQREYRSARRLGPAGVGEGQVVSMRTRFDWYWLAGLLFIAAVTAYASHMTGETRHWMAVGAFLLCWALLRWLTPRKMTVHKDLMSVSDRQSAKWAFVSGLAGFGCCVFVKARFPEAAMLFTVGFLALWGPWAFAVIWRSGANRRRREQEAADAERASGRLVPEELLTPWT